MIWTWSFIIIWLAISYHITKKADKTGDYEKAAKSNFIMMAVLGFMYGMTVYYMV